MYNTILFKGFKRSGNHLIIFNIINNILNKDSIGSVKPSNIGTFMFYNHDKKIIFFNCIDANFDVYNKLFKAGISDNITEKQHLTNDINSSFKQICTGWLPENLEFMLEQVKDFLKTKITNDYTVFSSIEDIVDKDESTLLDEMFTRNNYKSETFYITRDINNIYASRKKNGWMEIGESFIHKYIKFVNSINPNQIIQFDEYIISKEYRTYIHSKINIGTVHLFSRDEILPVGGSSFDNSHDIFNRKDTLDDSDKLLLKMPELIDIKKKLRLLLK
mgnify:CR=1 FL=1|jgi:hypothetical protein|tara:strand:+ start:147 stop:971 length:825 start_codon:yes stop_codon:yes gene_type:complete